MCWSKFCIFFVLARVVCELNICLAHLFGRLFGTLFAYDQHRRSRVLRGTACCALPDENRMNVTAAPRPDMSTAALERRPA